jgi:pSer/pThr/pTyr-binding forkhead associated (FHA) protein
MTAAATSLTISVRSVDAITEPLAAAARADLSDRCPEAVVEPAEPGCYIQVRGPNTELLIPLGGHLLHVGRGFDADLLLDDTSVSRRHAIIVARGSRARLLDDRSLNGTFVNGRRIENVDLRDGDIIIIGRFELRYFEP